MLNQTISPALPRSQPIRTTVRTVGILLLTGLAAGAAAGCQSAPPVHPDSVRHIQIRDDVAPLSLFAKVDEEIRWENHRDQPVQLSLLEPRDITDLACNKGFQRFGQFLDLVTIDPHESVSLCFSKPTTIRYNVWLDIDDRQHSMTPTGHVRIN